jgi:hypothetical protein
LRERKALLAADLLVTSGFVTFLIYRAGGGLVLLPFALFLLTFLKRSEKPPLAGCRRCFFPFASGLLIWPMRWFYWDRVDFSLRVRNLLLLATLFFLFFLARRLRWPGRFLFFFNSLSLKKRLLAIFIGAEILFVLASAMLTGRGVALVGDEPHYLAISQSLARDGDLNVFNQYFRDGFKEFLRVEKLAAHGTWGKGYKKIYSYHLPGVSLTLAPFFFIKLSPPLLYFFLRAFLGLFGALLAALVYLFCLRLWHSRSLAFFATLVFGLTAPVFFYSFHIFPEVQAMLLILSALYLLLFRAGGKDSRSLWAGLLLGSTIFWGVKYALFIYPIALGFFAYWLWRRKWRRALLLLVFPLLFQALFFYYLYHAYGNFSPNSVYYGMLSPAGARELVDTLLNKITMNMRWETLLDYFFDQRDGLLLYNPFYFFAFPGLLLALKNLRRYRLHLLVALPALLFVLNHAFSTIRAGYCPQGRYLVPVAWALLLFALVYYRESRNRLFKRAFLVLPLYPLFITAYQVLEPFTLYQATTHDSLQRAGLIFQNWSNTRIALPAMLPSFIKTDNHGYLPNTLVLAVFLLLLILSLLPRHFPRRSRQVRVAPVLVFAAIFSLASLFPRPDLSSPRRLPGPRSLPCQVYFSPEPSSVVAEAGWVFSGRRRGRWLIETLVPLKAIEVAVRNRSALAQLDLGLDLFDVPYGPLRLPAGSSGRITLVRPRYQKIKARYYYQFTWRAPAEPDFLLELALR